MTAIADIMGVRLVEKEPGDLLKIPSLDGRLQVVLELLALWCVRHNAPTLRITDVDTPGVHSPAGPHYRKQAIDVGFGPLGLADFERFAAWVNASLSYGRGFHVAVVGRFDRLGRHNTHMHLQVPPPYQPERGIVL